MSLRSMSQQRNMSSETRTCLSYSRTCVIFVKLSRKLLHTCTGPSKVSGMALSCACNIVGSNWILSYKLSLSLSLSYSVSSTLWCIKHVYINIYLCIQGIWLWFPVTKTSNMRLHGGGLLLQHLFAVSPVIVFYSLVWVTVMDCKLYICGIKNRIVDFHMATPA